MIADNSWHSKVTYMCIVQSSCTSTHTRSLCNFHCPCICLVCLVCFTSWRWIRARVLARDSSWWHVIMNADMAIYTYKRVVCVCWFVCLLFIGHTTFVHFAALPPSTPREQEPSSRAGPRARAQACTARARARMPYNFSTKKSLRWCLSKTNPYARAHAVVLQFAFSWSVYFSNRTESYLIFGRSRPWSARLYL